MTRWGLIRRAIALPAEKKVWLVVFVCGAFVASAAVLLLPIRRLIPLIGMPLENRRVSVIATEAQWRKARRMGNLMHAVGERIIRRSRCLVEALCVKWLLNRYGIPAVFHLGATLDKDIEAGMRAHAWVRVGPVAVVGGAGERDYQIVATFTTPTLENHADTAVPRASLGRGCKGQRLART